MIETTTHKLPDGPKGGSPLGPLYALESNPLKFFRDLQRQYKDMAVLQIGDRLLLFCFKPEHNRYFLTEHVQNFIKPTLGVGANLKDFLGDGLLTIDGAYHRQQRRLVQPAFHKKRIDAYAEIMTRFTQEMLSQWQAGREVNMSAEMRYLTLRIIVKTLFNLDSPAEVKKLGQAFEDVITGPVTLLDKLSLHFHINLPFTLYGKSIAGNQVIADFIHSLIARRRAENVDYGDVLSMLLTAQEEADTLSDQQVYDHVLTFVAAGHETTQHTLAWTFYLLSQHPPVQQKLLAELHTVLQGRAPTTQDLAHLPYLDWVFNESWRIYPPAWRQAREAVAAFELDGYHFPAGTIAVQSQWVMHNLPEIWGDPENFRPERWDPANGQKVPQGAYFPFGLGPRICIGMPFAQMEARLILATILQHYTPRLSSRARIVPQPLVTLRPKYGMPMLLDKTRPV